MASVVVAKETFAYLTRQAMADSPTSLPWEISFLVPVLLASNPCFSFQVVVAVVAAVAADLPSGTAGSNESVAVNASRGTLVRCVRKVNLGGMEMVACCRLQWESGTALTHDLGAQPGVGRP